MQARVQHLLAMLHLTSLSRLAAAVGGVLVVAVGLVVLVTGSDGGQRAAAPLPPIPPSPGQASPSTSSSLSQHPSSRHSSTATAGHRTKDKTPVATSHGCTKTPVNGVSGATPIRICIPAIGVDASVMQLGLNADRTIATPPLSQVSVAGWYKYSPAPGVVGPSVILGHVDSAQAGRGVFFDLGLLHSGDKLSMVRADGMIAKYRVTRVAEIPKTQFPTQEVYGNTADAVIRLITCGGKFDAAAGSYNDNIIAFGKLVSLHKA